MRRRTAMLLAGLTFGGLVMLAINRWSHSALAANWPEPGVVVLEDSLDRPGAFQLTACPSSLNAGTFQGERYILTVLGRCSPDSADASISWPIPGLQLADGEVSIETQVLLNPATAQLDLTVREQPNGAYRAEIDFGPGAARLVRLEPTGPVLLAQRDDLGSALPAGGINRVALRARGAQLSLAIDGQTALDASDATLGSGGVRLTLARLGSPDAEEPTVLALRQLRVAGLPGSTTAELPVYSGPRSGQVVGPGRLQPDRGRSHLAEGAPLSTGSVPPSSGLHYPTWTRPGVYADPLPAGNWVHSLEHGYIVLLYECSAGCPELQAQLAEFYERAPRSRAYGYQKLIVAPYPGLAHHLTIVAWDRLDELDDFDGERLLTFYQAYHDRGPENAP